MRSEGTAFGAPPASRTAGAHETEVWPVELCGRSEAVRRARDDVRAAVEGGPVLVAAEPGLDVAAVARLIHDASAFRAGAFVAIDCAATEAPALDRALFGATATRGLKGSQGLETVEPGSAFERGQQGTIFLSAVHELPAATQRRLARVLRDGQVQVRGSSRVLSLDLSLVAAGPPSLEDDVAEGRFRADLYRRLSGRRIDVPALRERPEDLADLVRHLQAERDGGGTPRSFTRAALALLAALPWEGNIGELRDVLDALEPDAPAPVQVEDLLAHLPLARRTPSARASLREARRQFEREYIGAVLREHGWRMRDAARALGMQRTNLYRKARQLNIRRVKVSR